VRRAIVVVVAVFLAIGAFETVRANSLTGHPQPIRPDPARPSVQVAPPEAHPIPNSMRVENSSFSEGPSWHVSTSFPPHVPLAGDKQPYNVLFCIADDDQPLFRSALAAYPDIGVVDYFDARAAIPGVATFLPYDAVVTYPNYAYYDMVRMGDTLAAYVRQGGAVICGVWCWYLGGNHLEGEIMDSLFNPFTGLGSNHYSDTTLGWYDMTHPIMAGVTGVSEVYRDFLTINTGADSVAKWDDGEWFVGTKGKVVGINGLPGDYGSWTGDMILIFYNAIAWTQGIAEYALFQDNFPWGLWSNQNALLSYTIPFDVYNSSDIGVVDLSRYKKVVIPSQQYSPFYSAVATNRAWFESYISNGGVLEFHGACYSDDDWAGTTMPSGFTCADQDVSLSNMVSIQHPGHPLVVTPNVISDASLDGWNYSTHSYLLNLLPDHDEVLRNDDHGEPCLIVQGYGDGWVIATMNTLEWAYSWGTSPLLENILLWMPGATHALFMDRTPWRSYLSYDPNTEVLAAHGIVYDIYNSAHMGLADLSMYERVITASDQPDTFYDHLSANRARFEGYMNNGGVFEFHGATAADVWSGKTMPTGFTSAYYLSDLVSIQVPGHPIVTTPNLVTDAELDGWNFSTHGNLLSLIPGYTEVLRNDGSGEPTLVVLDYGSGWLIATMNTLEWAWFWGHCPLLENVLLYQPSTGVEEIPSISDVATVALQQNRPNPFSHSTSISYQLPTKTHVSLKVYDMTGRLIRTLVDDVEEAGVKRTGWDGNDRYGTKVANGVYFYTLEAGDHELTKKLVFVR